MVVVGQQSGDIQNRFEELVAEVVGVVGHRFEGLGSQPVEVERSDTQRRQSLQQHWVASSTLPGAEFRTLFEECPSTENTLPSWLDQFVLVPVLAAVVAVVEHMFERTAEQHLWQMTWQQQLEQLGLERMSLENHIELLAENCSCGMEDSVEVVGLVEKVDRIEFLVGCR